MAKKKPKLKDPEMHAAIRGGILTICGMMMGFFENLKFQTQNAMRNKPPITKEQITAADFQGKSIPPKVRPNKTNTNPTVSKKVPE